MPKTPDKQRSQLRPLRTALLRWYDLNRRDLPWRKTSDPYRIWVSEIMLQQTRVAAVLEHYREFLRRFPTVGALAKADLADVLAAWSGLGYYRRARALHEAAKVVVERCGGKVPNTIEELLDLPGIGRYTAAAIGSIAFGVPAAVVDGNVQRVLARVKGDEVEGIVAWESAEELLDRRRPGDWNQAMMELGATVCVPMAPNCTECPVRSWCKAPGTDTRKAEPARRKRSHVVGLGVNANSVYLVRRPERESLMPGMWELPEVEENAGEPLMKVKHSITVTDFDVTVVKYNPNGDERGEWVSRPQLRRLALTGLARKILRKANLLPDARNHTNRGK